MYRGGVNLQGVGDDRLEQLKRQYQNSDGGANNGTGGPGGVHSNTQGVGDQANNNHGLSMHLQEQYDQHDADQQNPTKRQRGMGNGNFGAGSPVGTMGTGNNSMGNAGVVGSMNNPGFGNNDSNMNAMGSSSLGTPGGGNGIMNNGGNNQMAMMNGMGSPNGAGGGMMGGGPGGMMNGMNMNGMNMNNAAAMNAMTGGTGMQGMNSMGMQGMSGMNNMNSMNGMNTMANMTAAGGMGMNGMSNMNAMSGGMGMQGMNSMGMQGMNMAARAGMLGGAGGMGASDDLAAALYFNDFQNPAARMGLLGQRDPFMAAAQGLGGNPFGDYGRQNPYAGLAGFPNAGTPGAGMGPNSRRAQLMALMDMENNLQQSDASKANNGRGNDLGDGQPTQIPDPPMDIPTFSTATTPAILPLPPVIEEGAAAHFSQRSHIPLGIDEDNNWLTEFQVRFMIWQLFWQCYHGMYFSHLTLFLGSFEIQRP